MREKRAKAIKLVRLKYHQLTKCQPMAVLTLPLKNTLMSIKETTIFLILSTQAISSHCQSHKKIKRQVIVQQ